MEIIFYLISIPFIAGLLCLIFQKSGWFSKFLSIIVSIICIFLSVFIYQLSSINHQLFLLDSFNKFIIPAIALFGFLIILYSLKFFSNNNYQLSTVNSYYSYILWTLSAAFGAVLSNHLILLIVFWGFLGLTLYLLIQISPEVSKFNSSIENQNNKISEQSSTAAKKTFIIIGGSDCLMLFGIAIIWFLTGTFQMNKINISLAGQSTPALAIIAFLCLTIAAFAKAGAIPFHTWIPDMASVSAVPVTAFLPASLDKFLGIYLLVRICMNLFHNLINQITALNLLLMVIGAITIIAAVFMAMVQHDLKKLLSYHAVSQVGYMVLGIGTGNPIGIAGGIFHMLNNAIYKACLFLCGGSVEHRTGTSDLNKLGGLAQFMPLTFITCFIAALSISGVPPFNGFVSKWMIYQGIIQLSQPGLYSSNYQLSIIWWIFLLCAMFGSALTLASFMKLIYAVFLGQTPKHLSTKTINEVHWTMYLPQIIFGCLCVIFGIFAFQVPLKYFILPSLNISISQIFIGIWQPGLATVLIITGIIFGLFIYLISKVKVRESSVFIGGETLTEEVRVTGVDFYQTVKDIGFFKQMYFLAEKKIFDIYDWGKNIILSISSVLSFAHTGNLHTYLIWCFTGILILLFSIVK